MARRAEVSRSAPKAKAGGVPDRCPPQRLELRDCIRNRLPQAGLRACKRHRMDAGSIAFPRSTRSGTWIDFACLPLRGQRRNRTGFPFHLTCCSFLRR